MSRIVNCVQSRTVVTKKPKQKVRKIEIREKLPILLFWDLVSQSSLYHSRKRTSLAIINEFNNDTLMTRNGRTIYIYQKEGNR